MVVVGGLAVVVVEIGVCIGMLVGGVFVVEVVIGADVTGANVCG